MDTIAVVMSCFNRREITLRCLRSLHEQRGGFKLVVFLLDDGSTDGTSSAVRTMYPETNILQGNGKHFWGGGMYRASLAAMRDDFDFMLWLNDDVTLDPDALEKLCFSYRNLPANHPGLNVVVGAVQDGATGELSYSGFTRTGYWNPAKLKVVIPDPSVLQKCDTMNGNCVLIPRTVVETIGTVDPIFVHQLGDLDYGYRVRKAGGCVWVCNTTIGTCSRNPGPARWQSPKLTLKARLQALASPHGLPLKPWFFFLCRHSSLVFALLFLPYLYSKAALYALFPRALSR